MNITSYFKIIRPLNFLFVIIAVLFGAMYKADSLHFIISILAAFSAALISGGGYVINDYFDRDIDKINRPERPIPSGKISIAAARRYAIILFSIGFILSFFLNNVWIILIALCDSLLLYFYAYKGKKIGLWGNLIVAIVAASTFIYGGLSNNNIVNSLFCFGCALFYTVIRELVKDIEDVEGDRKIKAKTVPIMFGQNITIGLAFLFWLFLTILTISGLNHFYKIQIFITIIILVNTYLLVNLIVLTLYTNKKVAGYSEKIMKLNMFIFLILLWIGQ